MNAAARVDFDRDHVDVLDMVAELVDQHTHRETYDRQVGGVTVDLGEGPRLYGATHWTQGHVTNVPPLLDQLQTAIPTSAGDDQPTHGGGFESQPAAHLESLDTLMLVDREASRVVRDAGHDDYGLTTVECVRRVGSLLPGLDWCGRGKARREGQQVVCCPRHRTETVVRRWWAQARVATGWDSPAWRPDSTCPVCARRGGLRVRLSSKVAACVDCRETWDPGTIGLLAEHIRVESFAEARTRRPLACGRVEGYEPDDLKALCPACGSARCRRAVAARLDAASVTAC